MTVPAAPGREHHHCPENYRRLYFTVVGFLVDTWGIGLKDAFVHNGLSRIELDLLLVHAAGDDELVTVHCRWLRNLYMEVWHGLASMALGHLLKPFAV